MEKSIEHEEPGVAEQAEQFIDKKSDGFCWPAVIFAGLCVAWWVVQAVLFYARVGVGR